MHARSMEADGRVLAADVVYTRFVRQGVNNTRVLSFTLVSAWLALFVEVVCHHVCQFSLPSGTILKGRQVLVSTMIL